MCVKTQWWTSTNLDSRHEKCLGDGGHAEEEQQGPEHKAGADGPLRHGGSVAKPQRQVLYKLVAVGAGGAFSSKPAPVGGMARVVILYLRTVLALPAAVGGRHHGRFRQSSVTQSAASLSARAGASQVTSVSKTLVADVLAGDGSASRRVCTRPCICRPWCWRRPDAPQARPRMIAVVSNHGGGFPIRVQQHAVELVHEADGRSTGSVCAACCVREFDTRMHNVLVCVFYSS